MEEGVIHPQEVDAVLEGDETPAGCMKGCPTPMKLPSSLTSSFYKKLGFAAWVISGQNFS